MGKRSKKSDQRVRIRVIMKYLILGLSLIVVAVLVVPAINQELASIDKNSDAQEKIEDQDHWEGIIKQHEIVPDVIDDAEKAAVLEVCIFRMFPISNWDVIWLNSICR